jgi:hypothetical protein
MVGGTGCSGLQGAGVQAANLCFNYFLNYYPTVISILNSYRHSLFLSTEIWSKKTVQGWYRFFGKAHQRRALIGSKSHVDVEGQVV